MAMFVDQGEGRAIADALVILNGYCLHRMSTEGTGRHKFAPLDPALHPEQDRRTPEEFVRRATSHLLERYRIALAISTGSMYQQDNANTHHKTARGGLFFA